MMLVSVLFFYGKWLFAARNTSYVIHINVVIPGKFDKTLIKMTLPDKPNSRNQRYVKQ